MSDVYRKEIGMLGIHNKGPAPLVFTIPCRSCHRSLRMEAPVGISFSLREFHCVCGTVTPYSPDNTG